MKAGSATQCSRQTFKLWSSSEGCALVSGPSPGLKATSRVSGTSNGDRTRVMRRCCWQERRAQDFRMEFIGAYDAAGPSHSGR